MLLLKKDECTVVQSKLISDTLSGLKMICKYGYEDYENMTFIE